MTKSLKKNEVRQDQIKMLQNEINEKNKTIKELSTKVVQLKEDHSEVVKGNCHLVEVLKNRNLELKPLFNLDIQVCDCGIV